MPRADFRLSHSLRVRWSEVDPQNIVFNAHYLTYVDIGATEYWRALGFEYPHGFEQHGVDTFAVSAKLDYHKSARYDDQLEICVRAARLGRTSLRLAFEIHRAADHLVSGELTYVIAERASQKPVPIPQTLRAAILYYEPLAPEQ